MLWKETENRHFFPPKEKKPFSHHHYSYNYRASVLPHPTPHLLPPGGGDRKEAEQEALQSSQMAMASPRLLRGLIAPLPPSDWLPCNCNQLLASASSLLHRWLSSRCPDGFKLLLVLLLVSAALAEVRFVASSSMAPTLRPGDRAVAEKVTPIFPSYLAWLGSVMIP